MKQRLLDGTTEGSEIPGVFYCTTCGGEDVWERLGRHVNKGKVAEYDEFTAKDATTM